jgi:hypothetical protein
MRIEILKEEMAVMKNQKTNMNVFRSCFGRIRIRI